MGGDSTEIGSREFTKVGEVAVYPESTFRDIVLGGGAMIPNSTFDGIGFTAEELSAWGPPENRDEAPASFCEKLNRAQRAYIDLKTRMPRLGSISSMMSEISEVESSVAGS